MLFRSTAVGLAIAVGIRQARAEAPQPTWRERPRRFTDKTVDPV